MTLSQQVPPTVYVPVLNESVIQIALFFRCSGNASIIVPNYTRTGWFESDLWVLHKTGYTTEHEIKMSRSDFAADSKKRWGLETKHELLAQHSERGPSRFYFVCPSGLLPIDDIPLWAGLLYVENIRGQIVFDTIRRAPRLHKVKADPLCLERASNCLYHRYWWMRHRNTPTQRIGETVAQT